MNKKNVNAGELFRKIATPGRRLVGGKLVPVLKAAVDSDNVELIMMIAKRYPNTFKNARTYIGKRRNTRVDAMLAATPR